MRLSDDGVVVGFQGRGGPAESSGVPLGAKVVGVNGAPVASKDSIVRQLRSVEPRTPVMFTFMGSGRGRKTGHVPGRPQHIKQLDEFLLSSSGDDTDSSSDVDSV